LNTNEYLDAVKAKLSIPSDYALAKVLGLSHQSIPQFRTGKSAMGIETCMKVGEFLDIDGHAVYAQGQMERAKKPEIAEFWMTVSEKFSASFLNLLPGYGPRRYYV
jgi:DNA-binding XRE family transcriptional regulator